MHTKPFISVNRVATVLGVHHTTAKRTLKALGIGTVLIGKRSLYRTKELAALLEPVCQVRIVGSRPDS